MVVAAPSRFDGAVDTRGRPAIRAPRWSGPWTAGGVCSGGWREGRSRYEASGMVVTPRTNAGALHAPLVVDQDTVRSSMWRRTRPRRRAARCYDPGALTESALVDGTS